MTAATASRSAQSRVDAGRRGALVALPALLFTGGLAGTLPAHAQAAFDVSAIERAAADADLHSVLVWRAGRMLVEHYRPSKDRPVGDWLAREVTFGPDVSHAFIQDVRSFELGCTAPTTFARDFVRKWNLPIPEAFLPISP